MKQSVCEIWHCCRPLTLSAIGLFYVATFVGSLAEIDTTHAQTTKPKHRSEKSTGRRPQRQVPAKVAVPKPETLLALIRLHLIGLDQAIKAKDFRVLHAISAPGLQAKLTPKQLAAAFAKFFSRRTDFAATAITTPQITESPAILQGNILNIVGYFPTRPERIEFHMQFEPADRQWKLRGMNVSAKPIVPATSHAAPSVKPTGIKQTKNK